jgi:hypothetical protein
MHSTGDRDRPIVGKPAALDEIARDAPESVWDLLDRSTLDETEGTMEEARQDLDAMRGDPAEHLTASIASQLMREPDEATVKVVLPHLCRCSWCRGALQQAVTLCGNQAAPGVLDLIAEAEDWARWKAAGRQATETARRQLRTAGGSIIYAHEDAIWEEKPDGTAHRVAAIREPEPNRR